ncbi:hypothetical protein FRX31_005411 [Thalictrum thalictroides]|uniref:Uncharacterized protein n=1 Tax=Thalictrum thalictroides TaxID=46969 RepID=A0A7J6X5I4_THATH|nr:hypothetical protein FRX31_005411 [Thalictrum thalictroides]
MVFPTPGIPNTPIKPISPSFSASVIFFVVDSLDAKASKSPSNTISKLWVGFGSETISPKIFLSSKSAWIMRFFLWAFLPRLKRAQHQPLNQLLTSPASLLNCVASS